MAVYTTQLQSLYVAYFCRPADVDGLNYWEKVVTANNGSTAAVAEAFAATAEYNAAYAGKTQSQLVNAIYMNLFGHPADVPGLNYWVDVLQKGFFTIGNAVTTIAAGALTTDKEAYDAKVAAAVAFTNELNTTEEITAYSGDIANAKAKAFIASVISDATLAQAIEPGNLAIVITNIVVTVPPAGFDFDLTLSEAAGADVMVLRGNQDVRLDFTDPARQVRGLDLNHDGRIAIDGVENVLPLGPNADLDAAPADGTFEIVDAYARNRVNEADRVNNFLGDIYYDGEAFDGDGVSTDGNIFLGGLGADTALGGVGNDFFAGGGVAESRTAAAMAEWKAAGNPSATYVAPKDEMHGGRNADFFFAELSLLDNTDGNHLNIFGGATTDDAAVGNNTAQDSDWVLLEISDDEDGAVVDLRDFSPALGENVQSIKTGEGRAIKLDDIENIDASGNLYGFLDDVDVELGAHGTFDGDENVGGGSSSQLLIIGSAANNIFVGGYDNDRLEGRDGNDLLFGGNLNYRTNPNLANIVNNGMDEMYGGAGDDSIVFEADSGIIDGDTGNDTLWLTANSLGTLSADDLLADGVLRFDLLAENLNAADGYDGTESDVDFDTQDQTNYKDIGGVTITGMESVIATGLGAVDYLAAGANDPELNFHNQQNHRGYMGDLTLRGTNLIPDFATGQNTLYANTGDDLIEGRTGDDLLSGGAGDDDFVFDLNIGDDVDTIWRQSDTNNDNLWDRSAAGAFLYQQDFGVDSSNQLGASTLEVNFGAANLANLNVSMSSFSVVIGGVTFAVTDMDALAGVTTVNQLAALANDAFSAIDANVSVMAQGDVLTIADSTPAGGRVISDTQASGYNVKIEVIAPGTGTLGEPDYTAAGDNPSQDRLVFRAYSDRADNELVDDDAFIGGDWLGADAYAQDLVVGFDIDGNTRIAEDQRFRIDLDNLTVEDLVTVFVNDVEFTLTVGRAVDGTLLNNESTKAFAFRMASFINTYLDDDTAAGSVAAVGGDGDDILDTNEATVTLSQRAYAGEETVFMDVSVNVRDNSSGGQRGTAQVVNESQTDINLFMFDGRNNALRGETVLFVGDTDISRAVLATAKEVFENAADARLTGSDAIVINVTPDADITASALEGIARYVDGVLTAQPIGFNDAETPTTGVSIDFALHGDDQLFGGSLSDIIVAGTGDDRVYGSLGADRIDGGKDLYRVDGVIRVLNDAEAAAVDALPATLSIALLGDTDNDGNAMDNLGAGRAGNFDDTLIYQQSDFGAAKFAITLDLSAQQLNGGAGRVVVNNAAANTSYFTNMENIRTVSGNGTLAGQGDDTLNLAVSVNPLTGVETANSANMTYSLTKAANGGGSVLVEGVLFTKVDGVENVLTGSGNDVLNIDQSEAGKNNAFNAGLNTGAAGFDTINYQNNAGALNAAQLPSVVLAIGAANVDTVTMSGGMLPDQDRPVDTLTGVEWININAIAQNIDEADVLDVSALTAGAYVNLQSGVVYNGPAITANKVATVQGITQFEQVLGSSANDTVLVANTMVNASSDVADLVEDVENNILFDSFLTYDSIDEVIDAGLDADNLFERMNIADLRSADRDELINDVINQGQYTFTLGGGNADRVDYSLETGGIAAVVDVGTVSANILVDQAGTFLSLKEVGDRIDVLEGVEEIVAAQGDSILDFTSSGSDVQITFQYQVANSAVLAEDQQIETIVRIANGSGNVIEGLSAFVERYTAGEDADNDVTWNRIEGSDMGESVRYEGSENLLTQVGVDHRYSDDELNLRGGANGVSYTALETSIRVDINVTEDTGSGDGMIEASVEFDDGNGDGYTASPLADAGTHAITSYSADNSIAAGSLKIEASQDAEDVVAFNTDSDKIFLLGQSAGVLNVTILNDDNTVGTQMVLTGFEFLEDADSDDVYDFSDLETVQEGLQLIDNGNDDTDTIKVGDDAVGYDGGPAALTAPNDTISLEVLNDIFGFDFDVLDITKVEEDGLIIVGDDDDQDNDAVDNDADTNYTGPGDRDEDGASDIARDLFDDVIVGDLDLIESINGFDAIWFNNASRASGGADITLDLDAFALLSDAGDIDTDAYGLNFSLITSGGMNVSIIDNGAFGADVVGTRQADTITGGAGNDYLFGLAGNDVINGGGSEVQNTFEIVINTNPAGAAGDGDVIVDGVMVDNPNAADSSSTIGNSIVAYYAANPTATFANVVPSSVSFAGGVLSVSFDEDMLVADIDAAISSTDTGAFALNAAETDEYAAPGAGDDFIRGGAGADSVSGGAGNDAFVVVGAVDSDAAAAYALQFPDQDLLDLFFGFEDVVLLEELTEEYAGDISGAEVIAGGDGIDTLFFFGDTDLSAASVTSVEAYFGFSELTITLDQLAGAAAIFFSGFGPHALTITTNAGAALSDAAQAAALTASNAAVLSNGAISFAGIDYADGAAFSAAFPFPTTIALTEAAAEALTVDLIDTYFGTSIDITDTNAAQFSAAQVEAFEVSGIEFTALDTITLLDTAANIVALSDLALVGGIDLIDASNNAVTLTLDQAALISDDADAEFAASDSLTVSGQFSDVVDYADYAVADIGGDGTVVLDDADNLATVDAADVAVIDAANAAFDGATGVAILSSVGADTLDFNAIGGAALTLVIDALNQGADSVANFATGTDVLDFAGLLNIAAPVYEEIATDASDIGSDADIIVINAAANIGAAAAWIAGDASVTGMAGLIVINNGVNTEVWYSTDLGADGTETLLVTLTGVAPNALAAGNFDLTA